VLRNRIILVLDQYGYYLKISDAPDILLDNPAFLIPVFDIRPDTDLTWRISDRILKIGGYLAKLNEELTILIHKKFPKM
jgi:hypothetical protein